MVRLDLCQEETCNSCGMKVELDSYNSNKTTAKEKMPKHVQFSDENVIHEIPHIDDLSEEEIQDVWMSPDDFKDIRRECQKIIMIIEHDSSLIEGMGIELRGLEHHMLKQRKHIEGIQDLLYDTVDRLMRFHDETNMDVGDMLAEMCQKISSRSENLARKMGVRDEAVVKKLRKRDELIAKRKAEQQKAAAASS